MESFPITAAVSGALRSPHILPGFSGTDIREPTLPYVEAEKGVEKGVHLAHSYLPRALPGKKDFRESDFTRRKERRPVFPCPPSLLPEVDSMPLERNPASLRSSVLRQGAGCLTARPQGKP